MVGYRRQIKINSLDKGGIVARFQSDQSIPPRMKTCQTVSVDGEFNIALTAEGKAHIGYYWSDAEEAMQTAMAAAVTQLLTGTYEDYCEIDSEPEGCLYVMGSGNEQFTIDDHPVGGAHWVNAAATIYIGETFGPEDERCNPEGHFEEAQYPRLEVSVTAPTRPNVYLRPFFESLNTESIPVFTHVNAREKVQDFIDACLALPDEDLVVTPSTIEDEAGFIFELDGNRSLQVATRTTNVVSIFLSDGSGGYVQCVGIYGARSGDWDLDTDMTLTLQTDGYVQVQTTFGVDNEPSNFLVDPISFRYNSGTEEVGFKEVFELHQTVDGDWEMRPTYFGNPNPTSSYYQPHDDEDGNPQLWVGRGTTYSGPYSAMSGTMSLDLGDPFDVLLDSGDPGPLCEFDFSYINRRPFDPSCGPSQPIWMQLWVDAPTGYFPPPRHVACQFKLAIPEELKEALRNGTA